MTPSSWVPMHPVKTTVPQAYQQSSPRPLANFLGLFSLALGAAELLAPGRLAKVIGFQYSPTLLQAYGAREVAAGIGILAQDRPAKWLWARVAGDMLDLATLAASYEKAHTEDRRRLLGAAAAVAGVTVLDLVSAADHCRDS